jgi:hypothetical protein
MGQVARGVRPSDDPGAGSIMLTKCLQDARRVLQVQCIRTVLCTGNQYLRTVLCKGNQY